jgi:DNA helicase-2/ATP-dependent DNA helicase PcrA
METVPVSELVQGVLEDSGYLKDLQTQGTEEAEDRVQNVQELFNAVLQFEEESEDVTLQAFLSSTALSSDLDNLKEGETAVSLLTLHASKGLEFPVVFLVGMEQGLFPNYRSMNDPASLEEERRLCYVGITRAQERLYISHARERRLYGSREPAMRSQFLDELPEELLMTRHRSVAYTKGAGGSSSQRVAQGKQGTGHWQVGEKVLHKIFGVGEITHIFGSGSKISLAIKFDSMGQKIIDPRVAQLQRVD